MVSKNPCAYTFELLKIGHRTFRVPLIDNNSIGKVIESSTLALP